MNNNISLSLQSVGISYRERNRVFSTKKNVLKDIDLDVLHGETLGVYGSNGAGKSTLLGVMAGVLSPDHGAFVNHGNIVSLLNLNLGIDPGLTGRKNIFLHGLHLGYKYSEIKTQFDEIVSFAELQSVIDEPLYTYSTGMKARLGFSVAYSMKADVLLIDEVLGVGDQNFRKKSTYALKNKLNSGQTVVLVSHNVKLLQHLSDRIVVLDNGRIVRVLTQDEYGEYFNDEN